MNGILKKLKINPPHKFLCLNAPADFEEKIMGGTTGLLAEASPPSASLRRMKAKAGCTFSADPQQPFDSVHWFVRTQADVAAQADAVLALLRPGVPVWAYFPKGGSGIQTDLTRDVGWDALMRREREFRWLSLVSFDGTWSTFCFRLKTEKDLADEAKPKEERLIFQYADSATKTLRLPDDLQVVLERHPAEKGLFDALSFSNRREWVEWVITAKQAETRQARLEGTIERLRKGLKNPAGR